jgi:hypothetical protein
MATDDQIDRFLAKYVTAHPTEPEPSREQIGNWIDNMTRDCGHIVYPMCGLLDWRSKLREIQKQKPQ